MWFLPLVFSVAHARVVVEDTGDCLDPEAVNLEVRALVGDEPVRQLDITARIDRRLTPWRLRLLIERDDGGPPWHRTIEVKPADCAFLPGWIARSVESGLTELEGWTLDTGRRPGQVELGAELTGTVPQSVHASLGGTMGIRLGGPWTWVSQVEGYLGGVILIPSRGDEERLRGARFAGVLGSTGIAWDLPVRDSSFRAKALVGGGPFSVYGVDWEYNQSNLAPRATATFQVDMLGSSPFRVGLRVLTPFMRLAPQQEDTAPNHINPEPWVRVGVALGVAGRIGR